MPVFTVRDVVFNNQLKYPDLQIEAEQTTFISGTSGCGKSTLLRMFNATVSPSQGMLTYNGRELSEYPAVALRREVALVGQVVYLFDGTIADNFRIYFGYRGQPAPALAEQNKCLEICCAEWPVETSCRHLSGGERQRVYTAIFLALQSPVLMLDEPSSALDGQTSTRLLANLQAYCRTQSRTLIVVSHDLTLSQGFADQVITLDTQRITPEQTGGQSGDVL